MINIILGYLLVTVGIILSLFLSFLALQATYYTIKNRNKIVNNDPYHYGIVIDED